MRDQLQEERLLLTSATLSVEESVPPGTLSWQSPDHDLFPKPAEVLGAREQRQVGKWVGGPVPLVLRVPAASRGICQWPGSVTRQTRDREGR